MAVCVTLTCYKLVRFSSRNCQRRGSDDELNHRTKSYLHNRFNNSSRYFVVSPEIIWGWMMMTIFLSTLAFGAGCHYCELTLHKSELGSDTLDKRFFVYRARCRRRRIKICFQLGGLENNLIKC